MGPGVDTVLAFSVGEVEMCAGESRARFEGGDDGEGVVKTVKYRSVVDAKLCLGSNGLTMSRTFAKRVTIRWRCFFNRTLESAKN